MNKKKAKQKAVNLLLHKDRTEKELLERLIHDGFPAEESEEAIRALKEQGYINDERYADYYVQLNKERKSKYRIFQELLKRGIEKGTVERALDQYVNEEVALNHVMEKKIKNAKQPMSKEDAKKIAAYLIRQGFPKEKVMERLSLYLCDIGCLKGNDV